MAFIAKSEKEKPTAAVFKKGDSPENICAQNEDDFLICRGHFPVAAEQLETEVLGWEGLSNAVGLIPRAAEKEIL